MRTSCPENSRRPATDPWALTRFVPTTRACEPTLIFMVSPSAVLCTAQFSTIKHRIYGFGPLARARPEVRKALIAGLAAERRGTFRYGGSAAPGRFGDAAYVHRLRPDAPGH